MASSTKLVGAASSTDYDTTDIAWANASNVTAEDSNAATCAVSSSGFTEILLCTMDGNEFAIPAGASIDGIEVTYNVETADGPTSGTVFKEDFCQLVVDDDMTGLDRHLATNIANMTNGNRTSGSSADLFGLPLTVDAVNDSGFGVALRFQREGSSERTLEVLWVKITVHYTASNAPTIGNAGAAVALCHIKTDSDAISSQVVALPDVGAIKAIHTFFMDTAASDGTETKSELTNRFSHQQGMSDGTTQFGHLTRFSDASFQVYRDIYNDRLANFWVNSNETISVTSLGTDKVTLSHVNDKSNSRTIAVIAFYGSSISAHVGKQDSLDGSTSEASDITDPGFEPEALWFSGGLEQTPSNGHSAYGGFNHGFADGTNQVAATLAQNFYDASVPGLLSDLENYVRVSTNRVHNNPNYGVDPHEHYHWTVGDFDSNGFTITSGGDDADAQNDDGSGYLALTSGGLCSFHASEITLPTSTGVQSITFGNSFAFTPSFAVLVLTLQTATDTTSEDSSLGDSHAIVVIKDSRVAFSYFAASQNGSSSPNCHTGLSEGNLLVTDHAGTTVFEADTPTFSGGGLSLDWDTVSGSAVKGVAFLMSPPEDHSPPVDSSTAASSIANDGTALSAYIAQHGVPEPQLDITPQHPGVTIDTSGISQPGIMPNG